MLTNVQLIVIGDHLAAAIRFELWNRPLLCPQNHPPTLSHRHFVRQAYGGNIVLLVNDLWCRPCNWYWEIPWVPHPDDLAFLPSWLRRIRRKMIGELTVDSTLSRSSQTSGV